jgi:hypothetical protein
MMPARTLLQFVLLIALIFAPICGMGGAMAMPIDVQVSGHGAMISDHGHRAETAAQPGDGSGRGADIECRMVCSAVLPPAAGLGETRVVDNVPKNPAVIRDVPGLNQAAEPRPPRLS